MVLVEGASKPASVVLPKTLLSEDSPFYEDAQWRKRYEDFTTVNQSKQFNLCPSNITLTQLLAVKTKEHEILREAVRIENMRMYTFEAQSR